MPSSAQTVVVLLAFAYLAAALLVLRRANELCLIRVEQGRSRLVRGRAPARLLADVSDIVARARVTEGTLRVVSERSTPRLVASPEFSEDTAQQLRNAIGQHKVLHFRTGRRP